MADVRIGSDEVEEVESEIVRFAMFKRLGASIAVGRPDSLPGNASLLVVSNIYGATFFAGAKGLYAARTGSLIKLFEAAKSGEQNDISEGTEGVNLVADLEGIHTLSLSADELLLAVCVKERVLIFSTQDLIEQKSKAPRRTYDLSVRSLAWSPSDPRSLLVLCDDDTLRVSDVSKGMNGPSRENVEAASWAPDGRHVAFSSAEGVVSIVTPDLSTVRRTIAPALLVRGTEDAARVKIDTLQWIRPNSMLLSLVPFADDGSEESDSPLVALETFGSSFADTSGEVREVLLDGLSPSILNDATKPDSGPYLHSIFVKEWNVVIVANRKSYDDHLNLVGWREEGVRQWQIEDDTWIPRVDMPESGDDNFVVGLAIDRTSTRIQLFDPRDTSGDTKLPPQPIMLYVTSEGTLNAFVFARLDGAKDLPNLVSSPRSSFAPLKDFELTSATAQGTSASPPEQEHAEKGFEHVSKFSQQASELTSATSQDTSARPREQEHANQDGEKTVDDISRLRQQAAEAAERRAAEARAAQEHALPSEDEDDDDLSDESTPPPMQSEPSDVSKDASRERQSEDNEKAQSESAPEASAIPLPATEVPRTGDKPEVKEPNPEPQTSKKTFAAQPPIPTFLPGSEGKQVIKTLEKSENPATQKPGLFAAQPPIPIFLPGSEGKQVIKPKTDEPKQKTDTFAVQPPIPAFLPGSEGKQVVKQLEKTQKAGGFAAQSPIPAFLPGSEGKQVIKQTQKLAAKPFFAAQPPIPAYLPGSEGKQVIKPVSSLTTSPFGTTQPKPSTPAEVTKNAPQVFAPFPAIGSSQTKSTSSPFGAFAASSGASSSIFGASANAFGQPSSTPFSFSTAGLGQESGRLTPAFGASMSPASSVIKPEASVPKFGEQVSDKPGFSGGFSAFAKPIPGETKSAQNEEAPESPKPSTPRKPSSPKRGHSSTDLQAEGSFSLDQGHVKRTAVRTAPRGAGTAGKSAPPEAKKAPDLEAEFVKELEEVQQMAAELDALLGPLKSSSNQSADAVLSRKSLEALFRTTSSLFQSCQDIREQIRGTSQRVQGLMSDTHQADAWRIVLESKVEQAKDERFRVLWDKKNLEPKVEAQRKALLTKDLALKEKGADLQIHLQTLELRQKPAVKELRMRGSLRKDRLYSRSEPLHQQNKPSRPSVQSLYSTVNTQMAIAQEQSVRLSHLMRQLGFNDPPQKAGVKATPRAKEILRSLDISPARRSPNESGARGRIPGSSGRKTLKGGTVFRVPDFDDVTDDVTPPPKQRLTYSPGGGAETAGARTPLSGRKSASPEMGPRSPQSERRTAREGLSQYHTPTTTIKRGAREQQRAQPPSPVPYPSANFGRRPSLAAEPSEESDVEDEDEQEWKETQNDFKRRGSGKLASAPPVSETRAVGGQKTGANGPPARRTVSDSAQKAPNDRSVAPPKAQATPSGGFSFSKEGSSAFGQTSLPAFEGFSFSTNNAKPTSKPGVSEARSGSPFSVSSSSKAGPGTAPGFKFDLGGSKLASAVSAPAQSATKPSTKPEPSPAVKLIPAKSEPNPFSSSNALSKSAKEGGLRSTESETVTISDDEGPSKQKDPESDKERAADTKSAGASKPEILKKEQEGQVSKSETATSSKAGAPAPSFGGFSAFAKPSEPFSFAKTPILVTSQSAASQSVQKPESAANEIPKPSEAKSSEPSKTDQTSKPFDFKPSETSPPPAFNFSFAPKDTALSSTENEDKEPTKDKVPENKREEVAKPSENSAAKPSETSGQEKAPAETTTGQPVEEAKPTQDNLAESSRAPDTAVSQQASQPVSVASPVSIAPAPLFQMPKAAQTSTAVPSSVFAPQQGSATTSPFSLTPAAPSLPGVNTSSPFSFAQTQPLTPSQTQSLTPSQTPEEKEESMDEEAAAPEGALSGFGGFGGFGLGSATPSDPSKPNPFGVTSLGAAPSAISTPPSDPNALFKPASFALPGGSSPFGANPSPPKPAFGNQGFPFGQPASPFGQSPSAFGQPASPGFGGLGFGQAASPGFGSPGQIGSATSSNQVIGGIVGGFGQTRTLGPGLPGASQGPAFGSAPTAGAFGSFAAKPSGGFGGFAGQAAGGGFAAAASSSGSGFGGFGGAPGGGFSGFAGAASQGGGFGGLNSSPTFGGAPAGGDPRFTQMRK